MLAVTVGPNLLHRKWSIADDVFPLWFTACMIGLGLTLLYAVIRSNMPAAATTLAASSILFMIGVVQMILPAIDAANSARDASRQIKALAQHSADPVHLYTNGWPNNEDVVYYLTVDPALPWIPSDQSLMKTIREDGKVVVVTDKSAYKDLSERKDLNVMMLQEYPQWRNKNVYLLAAREQTDQLAERAD
jgi:hypothetical protein